MKIEGLLTTTPALTLTHNTSPLLWVAAFFSHPKKGEPLFLVRTNCVFA